MSRRAELGAAASLACLLLTGCSDAQAGFGTPRQPSLGAYGDERETVTGVVAVQDNGCVDLDLGERGLRWIVWPAGTRAGEDGAVLVGDHVVADGDTLTGTGSVTTVRALPGWEDAHGTYFGQFGRFCSADLHGVVVFDDVGVATR